MHGQVLVGNPVLGGVALNIQQVEVILEWVFGRLRLLLIQIGHLLEVAVDFRSEQTRRETTDLQAVGPVVPRLGHFRALLLARALEDRAAENLAGRLKVRLKVDLRALSSLRRLLVL